MAFISKNPKLTTTTLVDQTSGAVTSPPSGSNKVINRNGILYLKSSAGVETPLGSGASAKNYLSSVNDGSAAAVLATVTAAGNVVVSGAFPNVTSDWGKDTTSSIATSTDNTLRGTSNYLTAAGTASASGATFVQTPAFNIDGEDLGKALAVQFDVTGNTTANDWDCVAVRYTSAGVFGALIPIAGTASTTTGTASAQVPTGTTTFKGFFITGSTASDVYSIRWRKRAGAVEIRLDNLIVGPQSVMLGTAITDWQSYTPTGSWTANTTYTGKYARVGQNLILDILVSTSGAPTAASLTVNIPSGLVIDTSALASFVNGLSTLGGVGVVNDSTTTAYNIQVVYSSTTAVRVLFQNNASGTQTAVNATAPITFGAGDSVNFQCSVPIVGYSSNVTMADRAVEEFASNSSSTSLDNATLFVNGPAGSVGIIGVSALSITITKRVRFQTPIQQTDSITLEFQDNTNSGWVPVASFRYGMIYTEQNTGSYGSAIQQVNSTDVDVKFGRFAYANGATFGANGVDWNSAVGTLNLKAWRVRKVSGGAAVGFPVGARNVIGDTTGTAVPAGMIGEFVKGSGTIGPSTGTSGQYQNITTISLTAGEWDIRGLSRIRSSTTAPNDFQLVISIHSGNTTTDHISSDNLAFQTISGTSVDCAVAIPSTRLLLSATTTVYFKAYFLTVDAGTQVLSSVIRARRVC